MDLERGCNRRISVAYRDRQLVDAHSDIVRIGREHPGFVAIRRYELGTVPQQSSRQYRIASLDRSPVELELDPVDLGRDLVKRHFDAHGLERSVPLGPCDVVGHRDRDDRAGAVCPSQPHRQ